jgi:hypothetical protein
MQKKIKNILNLMNLILPLYKNYYYCTLKKHPLKRRITIIIFLLLFVKTGSIIGQISVAMGYRQASEAEMSSVPIVVADPVGNKYSTAELSKQFPSSKIPVEIISVNFPDLRGAIDTASIIWYLKPENYSVRGEVNIVLVTVNADSVKTFYVDSNNDRTFSDSEEKFSFPFDAEKRDVQIKILGNYYKYTLINPDYKPPVKEASKTGYYSQSWRRASKKPSLNLDFSFLTGGGHARVSYIPVESIVESYVYQAKIVGSIKPTLGLDFSWFNFHIMGFGGYERLQYDETVLYAYSSSIKGGKQRYYDRGSWSNSKFHWGVTAEYDIRIAKVYLSPFATYSRFDNIQDKKFDKAIVPAADAAYREMETKEAGVKLKVPVGDQTLIYVKYAYSKSWFDVTDYILPAEEGTYSVDYTQNFLGVGIQYRLFR